MSKKPQQNQLFDDISPAEVKQSSDKKTTKPSAVSRVTTQRKKRRQVSGGFLLSRIDLYNWGPFAGRHHADIDPRGSAIIGPTGSGKTTVIDALMTLLTERPRYNLASTGGHESDRDLMSYIRGVSGTGNDADNRHVARPDKTVTALSASFTSHPENNRQPIRQLQIAVIFWIDSSSSAAADRKDIWLVSEHNDSDENAANFDAGEALNHWLTLHHEGGVKALKQHARQTAKLAISDTKKAYLGQVRRFFEVGENAFNLLNRAAGLKQLNSIDEIFRELVLENHAAFKRAATVVKEFEDLTTIRAELETAKQQLATLQPIDEKYKKYQALSKKINRQRQLLTLLPTWFALRAVRLWSEYTAVCRQQMTLGYKRLADLQHRLSLHKTRADTLYDRYRESGGNTIEVLAARIQDKQLLIDRLTRSVADYQQLTKALGVSAELSAKQLTLHRDWAIAQLIRQQQIIAAQETTLHTHGAKRQQAQQDMDTLTAEIKYIKSRPDSNIPFKFHTFRQQLAEHLGLSNNDLPFVAELVAVKNSESAWRGAIERAIGSHRLRILVPSENLRHALRFVNNRNHHLHVRLLEARLPDSPPSFFSDGFTRKLQFKPHPLRDAVKVLLANHDRHCVDNADALAKTPHAMTMQGLLSNQAGYFDKHDQKPLAADWMTGFDNRDRIKQLKQQLGEQKARYRTADSDYQLACKQLRNEQQSAKLLESLRDMRFDDIDLPGAQQQLNELQTQYHTLTAADSDTAKAKADYDAEQARVRQLDEKTREADVEYRQSKSRLEKAEAKHRMAEKRVGKGLSEADFAAAETALAGYITDNDNAREQLDRLENDSQQKLNRQLDEWQSKQHKQETGLVRAMEKAQRVDTGALAEVGTELADIGDYLSRLRILREEDLPAKQKRFLDYLNTASDQGVTQLLSSIEHEVSAIEERIAELNTTLKAVDFQPECYLQLNPQRIKHQSLRDLQNAQRNIRSAALNEDDGGEAHYLALKRMINLLQQAAEQKRTLAAKALLDPRYRLQFSISVITRNGDTVIETRTGSQGGSGGEKEIIASYILTASLSYALSPRIGEAPLFGTIVLDEAFSKSSQAVAGRIIEALRQFGLHPLFVTPNKEMRLLRNHTHSAILVYRRDTQATLTTLSWEALANLSKNHQQNPLPQ
ncbi:MAG: hypothetical protein CR975_04655 [Gammaproteobacteria bacterium]|nr:MAG: hypothetical protein CR975_04655 [Gammaproteobacteria bacterium]